MRTIIVAVVLVVAGLVAPRAQAVKSDQETLMDLERRWNTAFHNSDVKFIDSILDDDFVATYETGERADKARELALAASFNQQVDASALDDFKIKIYGNTAVVLFTLHLLGPVQGKPVEMAYQYIDVWVLRDGAWRCVASQSTRLVPPAASKKSN